MKRIAKPRLAAIPWAILAALPLLGACGGLPGPSGAPPVAPELPAPFENYPSERVPAFKRPPASASLPVGRVFSPTATGHPWGQAGRDARRY